MRITIIGLTLLALAGCGVGQPVGPTPGPARAQYTILATGSRILVTIEGSKQGKFAQPIQASGFTYQVTSPRDSATGMATGKRQHYPIKIVKEWDASSPKLFQALTTNELLKSVKIEVYQTSGSGEEALASVITLRNATVSNYKTAAGDAAQPPTSGTREEVTFTFDQIEVKDEAGRTRALDRWGGKAG